jgi:hypothetical protein
MPESAVFATHPNAADLPANTVLTAQDRQFEVLFNSVRRLAHSADESAERYQVAPLPRLG